GSVRYPVPLDGPPAVTRILFSPDGKVLAAPYPGSESDNAFWDLATGKLMPCSGRDGVVGRPLAFLGSGELLTVDWSREKLYRWDVAADELRDRSPLPVLADGKTFHTLAASPDGRTLVLDHGVRGPLRKAVDRLAVVLWDVPARRVARTLGRDF